MENVIQRRSINTVSLEPKETVKLAFEKKRLAEKMQMPPSLPHNVYWGAQPVVNRLERAKDILKGSKVLWVDDKPAGNRQEYLLLQQYGVSIDLATDTSDALGQVEKLQLVGGKYHVVISNMARGGNDQEGSRMLAEFRTRGLTMPVVFYILRLVRERGTPAYALGITNRPDELFHFVVDALGRMRE